MRFAFYLPTLRIDNSGFTFEEFLRNVLAAVKIVSPDNYPYPLYEHHHENGENGGNPHLRSNEMHMQWENYLNRYKILPEEADLIRFHKAISGELDRANSNPKSLVSVSFAEYVDRYVNFPVIKDCIDLLAFYFLHKTSSSMSVAEGIALIDRCFFERSELPFGEVIEDLQGDYHANAYALPALTLDFETAPRFRSDRLYCVLTDSARPLASTNAYYAHFARKGALANTVRIESWLSVDEANTYGTDPAGWQSIRNAIRTNFDERFTNARTEVSMT